MRAVMSEQLRRERRFLRLVCCCEDCDHFVEPAAAGEGGGEGGGGGGGGGEGAGGDAAGGCDLLYPTAPHRRTAWETTQDGQEVSFCKMFEPR